MARKKLDSYVSKLDCKQIVEGINGARRNALRLARDAEILLAVDRFATATSLAILSIEESGKEHILRQIATASSDSNDNELKILWKRYRTHTSKNIVWMLPKLIAEGARKMEDFKSLFESEDPYILDILKQTSMYCDCVGESLWLEPSNVIGKYTAVGLVEIAKQLLKDTDIEEKEIELWIKHMKNSNGKSIKEKKLALLHWYAEMHESGLKPQSEKDSGIMEFLGLESNK